MPKIVFMGTPEIAVPALVALYDNFGIAATVTVPDKPQGRGMHQTASPVKIQAQILNIEVLQPENLDDSNFINRLQQIAPDIIVVFAFRFLPKTVYSIAKIAAFNIHTSLLPAYRGAAPINWAIINGEQVSGLTAFMLEDKLDGGPIIAQQKITIPANCTATQLRDIMAKQAPAFAVDTCHKLISGNYTLQLQKSNTSKLAPKIYKHTAEINWQQSAQIVANFINGYSNQPCAWTLFDNRKLQILKAKIPAEEILTNNTNILHETKQSGEFCILQHTMLVRCENEQFVEVMEIKPENKKAMPIKDFINGYKGSKRGQFEYNSGAN